MPTSPQQAPPPAASRPSPELVHGVSLEQYAGITVALAEGFPLDAVLTNERMTRDAWGRAEPAWKVRVAKEGIAGPLFAELSAKRAVAEDCLARGVAPIDADLAAWMSFLAAYGAHAAPFELLQGNGLGLNDLSRLQRRWARRMAEDPRLPKQAAELAKKGPGPLPPLRVDRSVLKPFPWSPGAAPAPVPVVPKVEAPAETSLAPGRVRLFTYVIVKAQLAENPGDEARVLAKLGMNDFATTDAGWQVILRGDPELERDYRRLLEAQRAKIRAAAKQRPSPAVAESVPARAPEPVAPALPLPALPTPTVSAPVGIPRPSAKLAGTSLVLDLPQKAALPFVEGAAPAPLPAPPAPTPTVEARQPAPGARLAGTSLAVEVPARSALPFPAAPPAPAPAAATSPPVLTLVQHASLCCEIAEAPDHAMETLARYQVTPAAKQAADEHYAERFAREPSARAAWDRAYQTYRVWWLANRVSR